MPERKAWTSEEDEALKEIVATGVKKWTVIAKLMETKYQIFGRTGKQCRQRWFNQLNPDINSANWSPEEQNSLYELHNQLGNSWSKISQQLKGRTDNQVKNHFYSTIRKAFRRLNRHISSLKSQKELKTVVLTKLLIASEDKFDNKLKLNQEVIETSIDIKNKLLKLAYDIDANREQNESMNSLIRELVDFSKTWKRKKKKSRKDVDDFGEDDDDQSVELDESSGEEDKKVTKKKSSKVAKKPSREPKKEKKEEPIEMRSESSVGFEQRSSRVQSTRSSVIGNFQPLPFSLNRLPSSAFSLHSHESEDEIMSLRKRSSSRSSYSVFGGNSFSQRLSQFDPPKIGFNLTQSQNMGSQNLFQYPPQFLLQRLDD